MEVKMKEEITQKLCESLTSIQWSFLSSLMGVRYPRPPAEKTQLLKDIVTCPQRLEELQKKSRGYGIALGKRQKSRRKANE